jgi:hypothetical protein
MQFTYLRDRFFEAPPLGRYGRAQELTSTALDMLEPRFERNRVYYVARRAQALLDGGEIEQAMSPEARGVPACACGAAGSRASHLGYSPDAR